MRKRIAVIGGANMDIGGFPTGKLLAGDSNPGRVRMSVGGVGRNIAENICRMGLETELISAIGNDLNGQMILDDCKRKGIGTGGFLFEAKFASSVYLFIDDEQGDMSCAINDMGIQGEMTPEKLDKRLEALGEVSAIVIDANLPEESILHLTRQARVPVFADAVSAAKAHRLKRSLSGLYCLKPNRLEAELLTGVKIKDMIDAAEAARRLTDMGLKRVFLTMGAQGALCAEAGSCVYLPGAPLEMVNATGAGDAFTAALVWAYMEGMGLRESGIAGMAASSIAVEAAEAVNPGMSRERLLDRISEISLRF